jgi:hypothetical protein
MHRWLDKRTIDMAEFYAKGEGWNADGKDSPDLKFMQDGYQLRPE